MFFQVFVSVDAFFFVFFSQGRHLVVLCDEGWWD